ncbi:uncharacterized protein LOC123259349 isoform X3 [Cotesia glomerata]|uniref:uncharacterized protein LOC123259349 isoform X3 n=1 Tax=Cotesia glomerata TaxID=32391 RepID=UPI001D00A99F|nr:uncharacterized protein LOC123259349 isoform X3 [Cotesia glomerata]
MTAREVTLLGGSPWGFRMHGGHDLHQPLRVSRVNPGSKAAQQGVREGDLISSINGRNTSELTNGEAHTLLRNAGDQLKLGLNQEQAESPKRRIYRSSLQENTSIETLQKTTKTTTTTTKSLGTRIFTDTKLNGTGTDDTKNDKDFSNQNGSVKTTDYKRTNCEKSQDAKKCLQFHGNPGDSQLPEASGRMPHGSRARKTRRNRNKRTKQPPTRSEGVLHQADANKHENEEEKEDEGSILAGNKSMDCPGEDFLIESNLQMEREGDQTKVNGHAVKVSEVGSPSSTVIRSIESPNNPGVGRQQLRRVPVSLRHRLERRTLGSEVKICEISTVSGPLAASVGHIAGVGDIIVETDVGGQKTPKNLGPVVTISEPAEPSALMFLRTTSQSKDELEIQEIEGEGEADEGLLLKQQHGRVVVVEPDSDFEAKVIVEESSDIIEEFDSEICNENGCKDEIKVEEREIIIPDCDGNGESMDQVERDNREKILGQGGVRPTRKDEGCGGFSSKETIECKESADRMKCSMEAKCQESDGLNNDFKLGSTKGIDQPGTGVPTQELKNKLGVFSEGPELSYIPSDHSNLLDNSISLFDNHKPCQLVTTSSQINSVNSINSNSRREKMKKRLILESYFSEARHADRFLDIIQEEADKLSEDEEQHIRDFINEEIGKFRRERRYTRDDSENRSGDEDQDGGEEMESEREDNNWDFKDDKYESGGIQDLKVSPDTQANIAFNEKPAAEMIISSCEKKEGARKNKLILNNERSYSPEDLLRDCVENNKGNKVEDLTSTSRQVVVPSLPPEPPKRSSSFISRDIASAMVLLNPPQVDYPLPVCSFEPSAQTDQFYSGAEDTCDKPARPPLPLALFPTSNSSDSGWPLPISASIERNRGSGERRERGHGGVSSKENRSPGLRNEACDAVEIGNDADKIEASRSCPEIAYDHTGSELSATMSALQTQISGSSSDLAGTRSDGISACESQRVLSASSPVECYCAVRAFVGDRAQYQASGSGTGEEEEKEEEEEEEVESSRPFGYKVSCEKNKNVVEVAEPKKENKRKVEELDEKNQLETVKLEGEKRVVDSRFKVKSQIGDEDHNDRDCELKNLAGSQCEGQGANKTEESQVNTASVGDKIEEWEREKRREKERTDDPLRYQVDGENNQSTLHESREAAAGICFADTPATEVLYESSSNVESAPPDTCHAEFISGSSASENTSECAAKDLFYVPREDTCDFSISKGKHRDCPSSLTELSIRKILSMPYGLKIINEITHPLFNISVEKEEGKSFENLKSSGLEEVDSAVKVVEMIKRRPKSWMGVPTSENPQLLVCLSPSQQNFNTDKSLKGSNKSLEIRIPDADKLLDLHKKFINRRSYHDSSVDNRRGSESFAIPKYYRVEVNSRKESTGKDLGLPENKLKSKLEKSNQSNRVTGSSSNRLLKIIKENPIDNRQCLLLRATQEPVSVPGNPHKNNNVRQDRSKSTRLSEWLTLARNDPTDFAKYQKIYCHSDTRRDHCQDNLPSAFSPENRTDTTNKTQHLNTNTNTNSESISDDNINNNNYLDGKNIEGNCNPRVNSALIIRSPESSNEIINTGTLNKSPITYKSAIIDKSWSVEDHWNRTPVLCRGIDPGQVNPALINNDKPETPARPNRVQNLVVDRSCIDTTSIFDKTPPRRYLAPRKYHHPEVEALNHRQAITGTNAGIVEKKVPEEEDKENNHRETLQENLKRFRAAKDIKELTDARRRHSLPYELFDRQLEYINRLEEVLHSEVKIGENAKTEMEGDQDKSYYGEDNGRQSSRNQSKIYEKDCEEILTSEGHLEQTKSCQVTEDGCRVEKSIRTFENTEERKGFSLWTLKNENREEIPDAAKCMRSFDGEQKRRNDKTEKDEDKRAPDTYRGKSEMFDGNKMIKPTGKSISIFPTTDETLREKMYDEYRDKVLEREERKHLKVIKISSHVDFPGSHPGKPSDKSNSLNSIQREFIEKARNRMTKFGINLDDSETEIAKEDTGPGETTESTSGLSSSYITTSCRTEETTGQIITSEVKEKNICECRRDEKTKCLIDGKEIKDVRKLPKHLQEFLVLADTDTPPPHHHNHDHHPDGVWSPGSSSDPYNRDRDPGSPDRGKNSERDAGIPPVWTPSSAGTSPVAERKEFRPVSFESPILGRRKKPQTEQVPQPQPPWKSESHPQSEDHPPAQEKKKDPSSNGTNNLPDGSYNISPRIVNSHSVPSQGLNTLATTPRLPRAQNPTITLLQKAREGQLPKGAAYLNESICLKNNDTEDLLNSVKKEDNEMKKTPRKIEGIGPITKNGMPVALRSEVKEDNQAKWYKQMYDSLHRAGKDDDYVTIRYKPRRGLRYGHGSSSGYLSEPEPRGYADKSATLDIRRRQRNKENDSSISTMPRKSALVKTTAEVYRNQPGRIENYQPGQSTPAVGVGEKETKELTVTKKKKWWDEVMDIFDRAEEKKSQIRHPMALRTFIPTHQLLVRSNHNSRPSTTVASSKSSTTQSLHPKSSLRTTKAILEHTGHDSDTNSPSIDSDCQPSVAYRAEPPSVSLLLGQSRSKSMISGERMPYSLLKSPKGCSARKRHSKHVGGGNNETEDAMLIGFIDETVKPEEDQRHSSSSIEEKLKSLASSSPTRRSPLLINRSSSSSSCSNKQSLFSVPATSPRNHRNHANVINNNSIGINQRQHHDPSISSSTSSSSSSTIHITMLPPPPPPTNNSVAETALTSPSRPFDQHNPHTAKPYMSHALKESGYESDSTLIFRRRDDVSPLSPLEQRVAYKTVQKGGDVPLHGLRKLAPERPKDDTEIQYFPISSTLTRIRVRRKHTQSTSSMSSGGRHRRANSSRPSPPSPPRRQSSKDNATLKLYISGTGSSSRRHQQCFAAESVSNIRFLKERLSNKLLKQEQGRDIARKSLTASISSRPKVSTPSASPIKTTALTCAKKKPDCLTKRPVSPPTPSPSSAVNSPGSRQVEEKSLSKVQSKSLTGAQDGHRSKSYSTSLPVKKETKIRRVRKETEESSKLGSTSVGGSSSVYLSSSSSSHAEVVHSGCRVLVNGRRHVNVDVENTLTGAVVGGKAVSLRRVRSQETGLSSTKVISKSETRELEKTRSSCNVVIRSRSPVSGSGSGSGSGASLTARRGNLLETCKQKSSTTKLKGGAVTTTAIPSPQQQFTSTSVVVGNKRIRDKVQPPVKTLLKKSQVIEDQEIKFYKKKIPMKKDKLVREGTAGSAAGNPGRKKNNGKSDSHFQPEKRKIKKSCEKLLAVNCLKKVDKRVPENTTKGTKGTTTKPTTTTTTTFTTTNTTTQAQLVTMDRIKKHQEVTRTDNFFQNLFLRNISQSPFSSQCSTPRRSSVIERARIFQEVAGFKSEPSLRSLNVYLATKQPVSNSRFKNWERESFSSRSSSPNPFAVSWPGRSIFQKITKFDSLQGISKEFGSSSSLRGSRSPELDRNSIKERSLSEPPIKVSSVDEKITRRIVRLPPRSPSPSPTRSAVPRRIRSFRQDEAFPQLKARARSAGEVHDEQRKKEIGKGKFGSNLSLAKSTSSLESYPTNNKEEYQRYVYEMVHSKKKSSRYKDLHDFYASLERMGELEKSTSAGDLRRRFKHEDIIDYDEWKEIRSAERAEEELKSIYGKLRAVQREKDFLFTTKDLEKYRWHGDCSLRCKERSVENIRESFRRLTREDTQLEATRRLEISAKKDVYKPLWRGNSVVNVASSMTQRANTLKESKEGKQTISEECDKSEPSYLQRNLGGSKKFWSSLSVEQVNALKSQLNEIYGSEDKPKMYTKSFDVDEKISFAENIKQSYPSESSDGNKPGRRKTITRAAAGEIKASVGEFEVVVPSHEFGDRLEEVKGLSVRCHSMLVPTSSSSSGKLSSSLKRSDSISNGRTLHPHTHTSLTETEKKRLSLTLGKEILDKVSKKKKPKSPLAPRETLGAISAASVKNTSQSAAAINTSPRTCYSLETSVDDNVSKSRDRDKSDFLLVLTPNGDSLAARRKVESVLDEWSKKSPANSSRIKNASSSEIDSTTESSENSVKTVVQCEATKATDAVPRKVEFFEKIQREKRSEEENKSLGKRSKLSSSQSFADLKELFGEMESARYGTLGQSGHSSPGTGSEHSSARGRGRSTSASPDVPTGRFPSHLQREPARPRSVSPCRVSTSTCSLESLQHRCYSPDPEHYWRAYLNLVKHGAVKKLRAKFESLEELSGERAKFILSPKRFQSDPEITRNLLKKSESKRSSLLKTQEVTDVAWLRRKYEPGPRGKSKRRLSRSPPIPRIPLRLEDLAMPHINVISKTAELKDSAMSRSSSTTSLAIKAETEELEAQRPVNRIRDKFERMDGDSCARSTEGKPSILGEMFTSTPDVHELRDIAPYLAGRWVAHKYPSRRDNGRSLSLPPELESRSLETRSHVKTSSASSGNVGVNSSANVCARTLPRERSKVDRVKGPRAVSVSPVRSRTPTSILKQRQADPFANQPFDPSKHRPKFRYQPPPPTPPPPDPANLRARADFEKRAKSWWPAIPTYTAKPTVTFEEYSNAPPPPPPKSHLCRTEYQAATMTTSSWFAYQLREQSPRRYVEGEVTIHYRSPVRAEAKEILSEEELARRSAENMRRVYQEERRRKYLQELHDIDSRRHTDNFIPSQKSPIPLNRYDDFLDDLSYRSRSQEQTPEPRLVARAMYNFVGQTSRELSFRGGDIILIRRQIDKNWYEGEHNAMVGLFPLNYVEVLPFEGMRSTPKKPYEGQARARFNFIAQTNLELSLVKGELVVLTRRVDDNWFEGRIGNRKGIFPVTYVEVIMEPGQHRPETPVSSKPVASPAAHSMLSNGTASGKLSMGPHHYTPSIPVKTSTTEPQYISLPRIGVTERNKLHVAPVNETLHIDTHSDTLPYRALYNYRPQNEDELELKENDTVFVIEKCDDGWFVGSSQRTGYFGTFPGNYVERL